MADEETFPLILQFKDESYQFYIPSKWTFTQLHEFLEEQTDVAKQTQKLLVKLDAGKSKMIQYGDQHSTELVPSILQAHARVLLVGSTHEDVENARLIKSDRLLLGFDEEVRRERARQAYNAPETLGENYLQPRIGAIESLQQFSSPSPSEALSLIRRLVNDPGIVGIMNKHNWRVGLVKEMPPEGLVGVSEVCILGYNQNKGQMIALRLRTDDLKGFRKYLVIRDTLLHELCHNEFSEHDSQFWSLFRQLKREVEELDWSKRGATVGGPRFAETAHFDHSDDVDGMEVDQGHVLDPHHDHSHVHVPTSEMTREAAERRLRQLEEAERQTPPAEPVKLSSETKVVAPQNSSTSAPSAAVTVATAPIEPMAQSLPASNLWRCNACTYDNDLSASVCSMCGNSRFSAPPNAADLEGIESHLLDPQVELLKKIERSLDDLLRPLTSEDRAGALRVLDRITSNIIQSPAEPKFKSIPMTSKAFLHNIGRHFGGLAFLEIVGFSPDPNDKNTLKLVREDVVRLYLASTAVRARLAAE